MLTGDSKVTEGDRKDEQMSVKVVPLDFAGPLPKPTPHLEQAKADLDRAGYAILSGALPAETVREARQVLADEIAREAAIDEDSVSGGVFDPDKKNRRLSRLPNRHHLFRDILEHPVALELTKYILGPTLANESYLVHSFDANVTRPGSGQQAIHTDASTGIRHQPRPFQARFIWTLDEFEEENGATRVVPGSHLKDVDFSGATHYESVPAEAPAGSLIIYTDMLLHGAGANVSADRERASLNLGYCMPWHRPMINFPVVVDPKVMAGTSRTLRQLLGYSEVAVSYFERWDGVSDEVRALCVSPTMEY
ncbi:phytanoyl-CoA dioxygenase family protein [Nocardia rhamnosiphila]|uniref:phytanoyl-CoA dioxygenase family protein n=1 Tax=Nocardia rhamnosiphila TaxID=426716 RepID=UPI00340752A4